MNSLTILTIATMGALALAARYFHLDLVRERRRNARLRARIDELLDALDDDVELVTHLRMELAKSRHPAGSEQRRPALTIINGGAS